MYNTATVIIKIKNRLWEKEDHFNCKIVMYEKKNKKAVKKSFNKKIFQENKWRLCTLILSNINILSSLAFKVK